MGPPWLGHCRGLRDAGLCDGSRPRVGEVLPVFTRQVLVGLLAASVLLAAGCSPDKRTNVPTGPPLASSSAPSIAAGAAAEQDALVAYRGMWKAFVEAGKTSDAESADLRT